VDPGELLAFGATIIGALIVGIFGFIGIRAEMRARARSEASTRQADADRLLRKYRDPLARAAFDLQSRLYNLVRHDFLGKYLVRGTEAEKVYALESTLYVLGEYFGWVEIMRRENQFLDLGDMARNRELSDSLATISGIFLGERPDPTFRVFRAEQRAIGHVMTLVDGDARECIGYAEFIDRRAAPEFGRWFEKLADDVHRLAREPGTHEARIVDLQRALVDLLAVLDPQFQYFPERQRGQLPEGETTAGQPAPADATTEAGPAMSMPGES